MSRFTLIKSLAVTTVLLAIPTQAFAWKHLGGAWCGDGDLPLPYYVSPQGEDSVPEGYVFPMIEASYAAWELQAPCAGVSGTFMGECENSPYTYDLENRHSFDDPAGDLAAGVLAATLNLPQNGGEFCFQQDGLNYYRYFDSDIVGNNNVDFARSEDVVSGSCNNEFDMQSVWTHEIGHQLGLGHSCEQGEACTKEELMIATMYWSGGPCDDAGVSLEQDDIEAITALYGPYASIVCSNELDPESPDTIAFGVTPFAIKCSVDSKNRDEITGVTWFWGDGGTSEGTDVEHEYTTAGNYTLLAQIEGQNEVCGEWDYQTNRVGYVRACSVPTPEFTFDHVNGLVYQMLNETDVSVYGCIYNIEWDIYKDGADGEPLARLKAWEPKFEFPEAGTYRVVLNIGGPAGTGAAELMLEVEDRAGEGYGACGGCNMPGTGASAGLLLSALGLLGLRRRRS